MFEKTKNNIYKATLPLAIPLNQKYFVVNGKNILSQKYRAYKKQVTKIPYNLTPIRKGKEKNVVCEITVFEKDNRRDVDATIKIILDVLNGKLWEDDSQIWRMSIRQFVDKQNPRVEVNCIEEKRN